VISSHRRPSAARLLAREDRKNSRKFSLGENRLPPAPSGEEPPTDDIITPKTDASTNSKNGQSSRKPKIKSFEQLWSNEKGKSSRNSARDERSIVNEPDDLPTPDLPPTDESPATQKKTKIEKIVELQAKYDKYKQEWMQVTKEKRQAEKELKLNKQEITSLTKQVQTYLDDVKTLREKLADSKQKMETLTEEHYEELSQFNETTKELVQARIDYTKTLNESRELREDLQNREHDLEEKDKRIASLTMAVESQMDRADALDLKLEHADEEIRALEDQMKEMEDELLAYRSAAAKDEADGDNVHLKQARDDMEKRLSAERERRLNEKQKKLADKQREFEAEREKYLEKEKKREEELAQQELLERQKKMDRDEERQQLDGEISSRLKELENDNSALQARLKSEQLVSTDKMKKKDEAIAKLQKEMAQLKNDQSARDADPNSAASLQQEVAYIKAEAEAAKDELDEVQKLNIILSEEIEDLQAAKAELKDDFHTLQKEVADWKRQAADWQRKAVEWKIKSSDWTAKTFEWKDKAEFFERMVRELDPSRLEGGGEFSKPESAPEPSPQALFLQAAMNRKVAPAPKMGIFGGIFSKGSTDVGSDGEAEARCKELEEENAEQAEIIKKLRSEIVTIQASFKEAAYHSQKRLQLIQQENDDIALKNTNLQKELVLARKLGSVAAVDDDDSSPNF
jgi:aspartate beta-hydroxylase